MNAENRARLHLWLVWFANRPRSIWLFVFGYTVVAGLLIQLVLLPYVAPSWHAGNGLFKGMDGGWFHRAALELSFQINEYGWGAWVPEPDGQFVSGMAAIFYTLIYPAPWSVLPLNAALNATAAVCFVLTLEVLTEDRRTSLLAALPFIFFPSALLWNGQYHNDVYAVPGVILILYGWSLPAAKPGIALHKLGLPSIVSVAVGSLLLGLVRPKILDGMLFLSVIVAMALGALALFSFLDRKLNGAALVRFLTGVALTVAAMGLLRATIVSSKGNSDPGSSSRTEGDPKSTYRQAGFQWTSTPWLPTAIDEQLRQLAGTRRRFARSWTDSGSAIDLDVNLQSAGEVAAYLPRAVQIGLLSPFPNLWFTKGLKATGTAFRMATALETSIAYFCLLGLPYFMWIKHKQPAVWALFFLCMTMLVIYALTIPNVGSLYRFRYPFYMTLVCLGLAGWLESRRIAGSPIPTER